MSDRAILFLSLLTTMFAAWAGLVFGVSFLSARAKFRAPSISLRVALDVGRQTLRAFSRAEMLLAIVASTICVAITNWPFVVGLAGVWSVIVAERVSLLPVLAPSRMHSNDREDAWSVVSPQPVRRSGTGQSRRTADVLRRLVPDARGEIARESL
jgi:hypothetical protein